MHQTFNGSSWSVATQIQADASGLQLSFDKLSNKLVAVFRGTSGLLYKRLTGGSWDAAPTTLLPGADTRFANCQLVRFDGGLACSYSTGGGPGQPSQIRWVQVSLP